MSAAREAVAQALKDRVLTDEDEEYADADVDEWYPDADAALAALRPFIAAEIRAWAERGISNSDEISTHFWRGASFALGALKSDADAIAARITTTGEQQQ